MDLAHWNPSRRYNRRLCGSPVLGGWVSEYKLVSLVARFLISLNVPSWNIATSSNRKWFLQTWIRYPLIWGWLCWWEDLEWFAEELDNNVGIRFATTPTLSCVDLKGRCDWEGKFINRRTPACVPWIERERETRERKSNSEGMNSYGVELKCVTKRTTWHNNHSLSVLLLNQWRSMTVVADDVAQYQ